MRWKSFGCWALTLLLAVTAGCKQRVFLSEADYNGVQTACSPCLDSHPELACKPLHDAPNAPPTLYNLDRKIRFLSLAEAISTALEQGTVGQPSLLFPGTALDNLVQFSGGGPIGTAGSDSIRVLALDPARLGSQIDVALSKFDAIFIGSMTWNTTDQPIGTALQTFQAGASGVNAIVQEQATFSAEFLKPLPTGGIAGITFNVPYTSTNLPARVNPAYQPQLQFSFEQPLLQAFGVEINQLRPIHPGSILNPGFVGNVGFVGSAPEGILITRLRFDQQRAEFERNLNQMLLNVEVAYWNLYGAYWTLYSREQGLRFAFEAYKLSKAGYEAGRVKAADFYQTRGQYELFRAQRLQAIDTILDDERQLRALMGMRIEDGTRLMPADSPTLAPFQPDWTAAWNDAVTKRPELYMARQDVKASQLNIILLKNNLLPDLRFTSTYDFNAIGTRLDGSTNQNAFRNLADGNFSNWALGLRLTIPIGFRTAEAQLRQGQLQLVRAMEVLQDQERKTERFLGLQYRRLSSAYEQVRAQRAQREAFGEQLRARNQEFLAGRGTLDILLEAQRFWADALANEYNAIVQYNNAIAGFEFAKGTILTHDNIVVSEGALPECAQVRAVEHQRQRTAALVLRERAAVLPPVAPAPVVHDGGASPSLPALYKAAPPLKEAPPLPASGGQQPAAPVEGKVEELMAPTPLPVDKPAAPARPAAPKRPSDFGTMRPTGPEVMDAVPTPTPPAMLPPPAAPLAQ
jgi:outer membrane protein TolC